MLPCGTITLFSQLYGSESISQVTGIVTDYIGESNHKIKILLYDDGCHFKLYVEKNNRTKDSDAAKKLGQDIDIKVDKLHFRGHTDPWCNKHMDPFKVEALVDVNTVKAEQTFAWLNKFTMVKNMNNERFELFFMFICNWRNLQITNQKKTFNPKSQASNIIDLEAKLEKMSI